MNDQIKRTQTTSSGVSMTSGAPQSASSIVIMRRFVLLSLLVALLLGACGYAPNTDQSTTINVPAPASDAANLTLRFGAADRFQLAPGASSMVEGTIEYNRDDLRPTVTTNGSAIVIAQGERTAGINPTAPRNAWNLKLSDAVPLQLRVQAGAYNGSYDLGGLRLRALSVEQGAAQASYDFSKPNREPMEQLSVTSGGASLQMANLANANAGQMRFDLAAGTNSLDFGGQLQRSADVAVRTGAGKLVIRVPQSTPMRVRLSGALNQIDAIGFNRAEPGLYTNAAWDATKPHIEVTIDGAVGEISLESV
jgi:hypothetical protein